MTERTCPFCREGFELVLKDGHLTCPECSMPLIRKGEPGWDEEWAKKIMLEEYWQLPPSDNSLHDLIQIQPAPPRKEK